MTVRRTRSPALVVHGGCGASPPTARQVDTIRRARDAGYAILQAGGSSLDAAEAAVTLLERSGWFNAGKGSKRQLDGVVRMDAAVMDGRTLAAGAVASIEGVLTPIRAARYVMERTPHVLLVGAAAGLFARAHRVPVLSVPVRAGADRRSFRWTDPGHRPHAASVRRDEGGTVGAVALDLEGHLAAATSTGGISRMLPGRVGDSPLIGAGTYADDRAGAISATGSGETIIRSGLAKEIAMTLEDGLALREAGTRALIRMRRRVGGDAGVIVLSASGAFAIVHTTPYMISGYRAGRRRSVSSHRHRVEA
jgi:beta-aspartyl-peptidase (threonine type)